MTAFSFASSATPGAPRLLLAHGAGAGRQHPWMLKTARGLADRGVTVVTFDFPYMAEGRKLPDRGPVLEAAFETAWRDLHETAGGPVFAGGKSMGGRIAAQVAARLAPAARGLVFFGYPLHPPGKPDERRDRHLPLVTAPMLFLHGSRDPFGSPDEMRELTQKLPRATLEIVEGGDHSLETRKKQDAAGASFDRTLDLAAAWILARLASPD